MIKLIKQKTKWIQAMLSFLVILVLLSGCSVSFSDRKEDSPVKDFAYGIADIFTGIMGKNAITSDRRLKGDREFGEDDYVGTYQAEYQNFSGSEILFGGTAIKREGGNDL